MQVMLSATSVRYLLTLMYSASAAASADADAEQLQESGVAVAEPSTLGVVYIVFDVIAVVGSIICVVSILVILPADIKRLRVVHAKQAERSVLRWRSKPATGRGGAQVHPAVPPASAGASGPQRGAGRAVQRRLTITQIETAVTHHKLAVFEKRHEEQHAASLELIRRRRERASARVKERVEARRRQRQRRGPKADTLAGHAEAQRIQSAFRVKQARKRVRAARGAKQMRGGAQRVGGAKTAVKPQQQQQQQVWIQVMDPVSGHPYFYHTQTQETRWDRPAGLV